MDKQVEHIVFFENGDQLNTFLNSNWYDTATPFHFCVSELKIIKEELKRGHKLKIESNGKTYKISSLADFENWIKNIFGGGFESHVFN
ncbi:MAG: hypothetical protein KBG47_02685 [Bacteroidia bacterium]|nr:hypothetical protein [Bacteroidia bacterium]